MGGLLGWLTDWLNGRANGLANRLANSWRFAYPHQPIQKRLPGELVNQGRLEARGRTAVLEASKLGGQYPGPENKDHK